MSEWQPIESAPARGKKRLLFMGSAGKMFTGWRIAGTRNAMPEYSDASRWATHWMPLPAPPTLPKGEG